jgi:V/A-type H+-transporting ATPase subunit E
MENKSQRSYLFEVKGGKNHVCRNIAFLIFERPQTLPVLRFFAIIAKVFHGGNMSNELQNLLEKIQREGVDKAKSQAEEITTAAKMEAASIIKAAKDEAAEEKARAEAEQKAYAARAAETIRQAARDTILEVENAVRKLLEDILIKNVNEAMSDPETVKPLVVEAIDKLAKGEEAEVATSANLADVLRAALADRGNIKVITDETAETGFSVKLDGGRVEHDFKGPTIAEALAKRLRPALAELIK